MHILFLDTEFTGLNANADLISIALYHDENCYFYAELNGIDYREFTPWIKENVVVHLEFAGQVHVRSQDERRVKMKGSMEEVKDALLAWIGGFPEVEVWADVLAYDWVLFCEIFGGALFIPGNIYYIPFDLSMAFKIGKHSPDINRFEYADHLLTEADRSSKHHALTDAKVGMLCLRMLSDEIEGDFV